MTSASALIFASILIAGLALLLQQPATQVWNNLGFGRSAENLAPVRRDYCYKLRGAESCSGIAVRHEISDAILACGNITRKRSEWYPPLGILNTPPTEEEQEGDGLWNYDFDTNFFFKYDIVNYTGPAFRFSHIGTVKYAPSYYAVMAVNHLPNETTVEIFKHKTLEYEIEHQLTVRHPLFTHINGILPLSSRTFYASVSTFQPPSWGWKLESILPLPMSKILYSDIDGKVTVQASGLRGAAGMSLSKDMKRLFVAERTKGGFGVYARDTKTSSLQRIEYVHVGMMIEKAHVEPNTGDIFLTAIPNLFDTLKHIADPSHPSPSVIYQVKPLTPPKKNEEVEEEDEEGGGGKKKIDDFFLGRHYEDPVPILTSNDLELSFANDAGAIYRHRKFLVSTMFGEGLHYCSWPNKYEFKVY